jgi:hypothetical protein
MYFQTMLESVDVKATDTVGPWCHLLLIPSSVDRHLGCFHPVLSFDSLLAAQFLLCSL